MSVWTARRQIKGVMHHDETDQALVGDYARNRSDAAFEALVRRHVNLVYATALRQAGDRGLAEEITQNTFVALARKAPGLTGHGTIAGWLHRTALLEAQRRIRTELRRRRRETTAAELQQLAAAGAEPLDDLGPFLDEALLQLGEGERTALVLRFFQDRRLAEVGAALGISEEAARKRVDRAVARLAGFLRSQGFPVAGATASGLAGQAAVTAPTGLAASAAAAGLAAGTAQTALPGIALLLGPLTPAKAVLFGALLALAPLAWQRHQLQAAGSVNASLETRIQGGQAELARLQASIDRQRTELAESTARLAALAPSGSPAPRPAAGTGPRRLTWDDTRPWVRLPKSLVRELDLFAVRNHRGDLAPAVITALQLDPETVAALEASLHRFVGICHDAESRGVKVIPPDPAALDTGRTFLLPDTRAVVAAARATLFQELRGILPDERYDLLLRALRTWMPIDDETQGLNSSAGIMGIARRIRFERGVPQPHAPGDAVLGWSVFQGEDGQAGSIHSTMRVEDIPDYLRPHLQDWIDEARRANDQPRPGGAATGEVQP